MFIYIAMSNENESSAKQCPKKEIDRSYWSHEIDSLRLPGYKRVVKPTTPKGLNDILQIITHEVLFHQPKDIPTFVAQLLDRLVRIRREKEKQDSDTPYRLRSIPKGIPISLLVPFDDYESVEYATEEKTEEPENDTRHSYEDELYF